MKNIYKLLLTMVLTLSFASTFAMANPASVKCEEDGGTLTIVTDSSGAQSGICTFDNGVTCDEWAYFRGECSSTGVVDEPKACTMDYNPVCAEVQVMCIRAPCPPLKQTFGNKCEMDANKIAVFLYNGECKTVEDTKSITISKETDLVKVDIDFPLVNNKTIDDKIYAYVKDYLKTFINGIPSEKISENGKYEINITGETKKVGIVNTYKLTIYTFTGGAHGGTIIKTFNFRNDGTEIKFENTKTLKKVSDYSLNYFNDLFKKGELGSDEDWLKTGLEAKFENYSNWLVTELDSDTLKVTFIFPQYQIASYADGIKTIEIDLTKLK
ncbi:MAG: DUF333 domain-containing protein [Candidatus Gracilibacteria bacterium]